MFKEFLMKQMLKRQGMSNEQIEMMTAMVKKNPELFKRIAEEIKQKMDSGADQQQAAIEVMMAHKSELEDLMKK